ncbi:MAG: pyridoxal phosphate-dependent aminotransferase [Rhodobacteraceae bacterium]|nr:pyridoxal phosphate-dependent aminotransferase [Paracoccaceae bacterium]
MKLSNRIANINAGGSDGWELFTRAREMIAAGQPVIELTIGEHDTPTDPIILDAMIASARAGNTGYAAVPGSPTLRQQIAARYQRITGVETEPDNVLVTSGGQAALFAAHLATLNPGEKGLICDPYYATYPGVLRAAEADLHSVPTRSSNNFLPQRDELAKAAKGAKSLLINSPNNPTGVVYPAETLQMIADVCIKNDMWLISDEVYDSQIWQGKHISPRGLPGMAERTLVIGSMSKSHAMTGSRIGWIIGPPEIVAQIMNLSTVNAYGVPGFIQDAAEFALLQGPEFEAEVADVFRTRTKLAREILLGSNILRLIPAQGAMYLMLDVRNTGLSGEEFANQLLTEELIAVMPGESFGHSASGHLRVAMTIPDEQFTHALKRLVLFAERLAAD